MIIIDLTGSVILNFDLFIKEQACTVEDNLSRWCVAFHFDAA
jgi:hypothetical protein